MQPAGTAVVLVACGALERALSHSVLTVHCLYENGLVDLLAQKAIENSTHKLLLSLLHSFRFRKQKTRDRGLKVKS